MMENLNGWVFWLKMMNCWKNITTSEVKSALVIKKVFEGKIDTKFHGNAITNEGSHCICPSVILILF